MTELELAKVRILSAMAEQGLLKHLAKCEMCRQGMSFDKVINELACELIELEKEAMS